MKRLLLLLLHLLAVPLAFVGGLVYAFHFMGRTPDPAVTILENSIRDARQTVYPGEGYRDDSFAPDGSAWDSFDAAAEGNVLRLSYIGGMRDVGENFLELSGNGELHLEVDGRRRLLRTLSGEETRKVFLHVIRSGITDYSEAMVRLKRELFVPTCFLGSTCGAETDILVRVPQYGLDFRRSWYRPQDEAATYPDIIEFQLILDFEKRIRSLVPDGENIWE